MIFLGLFVEGWNSFHEDYSLLVSSLGVYSSEFFQRPVGFQRERVLNTKSGFVFLGFIYTRMRCFPMVLRHLGFEC